MATVSQIKRQLRTGVKTAMEQVKDKVCQIFVETVLRYYAEYEPKMYVRTYQIEQQAAQMANAAVKTREIGASFEVYFDAAAMSHQRGTWTEGDILDNVMTAGTHGGATDGGTAVWTQSMGIINPQIRSWVRDALIAAGIPIH